VAGGAWVRAVDTLGLPFLRAVVVGAKGTEDPYGAWPRVREVHEAGPVLVRPDGCVAWRQRDAVREDAASPDQLRRALETVLGRPL
jgi:2,4-dichlorophenol 6-monooxygenase